MVFVDCFVVYCVFLGNSVNILFNIVWGVLIFVIEVLCVILVG